MAEGHRPIMLALALLLGREGLGLALVGRGLEMGRLGHGLEELYQERY